MTDKTPTAQDYLDYMRTALEAGPNWRSVSVPEFGVPGSEKYCFQTIGQEIQDPATRAYIALLFGRVQRLSAIADNLLRYAELKEMGV